MSNRTNPNYPRLDLEERLRLTPGAREAFEKLCQLGCDPDILAFLFYWIVPREVTLPANEAEGRRNPVTIHTRPMDSWDSAMDDLSLDQLKGFANQAQHLWSIFLRLRKTPLVRALVLMGEVPCCGADLLGGLPHRGDPLRTLIDLPELAKKWAGPRQHPDFTRLLTSIYEHISQRTGQWHDRLVADTLNALFANPQQHHTENSLKQWRHDRGLIRPRFGPNDPPRI
jgi:hypothetical protein